MIRSLSTCRCRGARRWRAPRPRRRTARLAAPAIAQSQNKDRIIFAMSQEPVQFNPLLYVNTGTENVPEAACSTRSGTSNDNGEFIPNLAAEIPTRANGGISPTG